MENTVNSRVLLLKTHLNLNRSEFSNKANISLSTFDNISTGHNIYPKTINAISQAFNANRDWLLTGHGDMFVEPKHTAVGFGTENPYKDALVAELKSQVEYLKEMLKMTMGGKNPNFRKAIEYANMFMFPNANQMKAKA